MTPKIVTEMNEHDRHFVTRAINEFIMTERRIPEDDELEREFVRVKTTFNRHKRAEDSKRALYKTNAGVVYLTICRAYNCYGGSEEGGWYYTETLPVMSMMFLATTPSAARWRRARAIKDKEYPGDYRGHGVGGCGDDEGLTRGQCFTDDDRYVIEETIGKPYEWRGHPGWDQEDEFNR